MKIKKNKGFTIYEVLITIILLGIISTIVVSSFTFYYNSYQKKDFEYKVSLFEIRSIDVFKHFGSNASGTTEFTKAQTICNQIFIHNTFDESNLKDVMNPEQINYFVYEILYYSKFVIEDYTYEYSPATITKISERCPSKFTVTLKDGTIIIFHMTIYTSNSLQSARFISVDVIQGKFKSSFSF